MTKTKNEIIDPKFISLEPDVKMAIKECMEEYSQSIAKQKAIAFTQWVKKNFEPSIRTDVWYSFNGKVVDKELTTNQLYELWEEETKNNQP